MTLHMQLSLTLSIPACEPGDMNRKSLLVFLFLFSLLTGCASQDSEIPTVQIVSPENGIEVTLGERVLVQTVAQDDEEVIKVELWVDGRLYQADRPTEQDGEQFDLIQIWDAPAIGTHTLMVKAHDSEGQVSIPSSVVIQVLPPPPTPTPAPTAAPTFVVDPDCEFSARFVEDVTVPDDALYNSGVRFTKTWRLRNDGDCTWEPGTQWVFISGDLIGAQSPVDVELAEPGRIIDISVDMVAPAAPGTYRSYWRLQRPNGELFGDQAYVRIIVP